MANPNSRPGLQALQDELAREAGLHPENRAEGKCVKCGEPFSEKNVFTKAGMKETMISGLCEKCWDEIFAE